jgi:transposase-like protein
LTYLIPECEIADVTSTPDETPPHQTADASPGMQLEINLPSHKESAAGAVAHFHHESADGWTVQGTVSRGPHGHVISHLEVWPGRPGDPPSGSVTSRLLNGIRVGTIIDAVRSWEMRRKLMMKVADTKYDPGDGTMSRVVEGLFGDGATHYPGLGVTIKPADQIIEASAPSKPQPGRAPLPDELLQQVAEGYLAESAPGKPRGAVKRLAQQLGRPEQTVSRWVARARKDGWLGPGRQGHEGADPGPRLLAARSHPSKAQD